MGEGQRTHEQTCFYLHDWIWKSLFEFVCCFRLEGWKVREPTGKPTQTYGVINNITPKAEVNRIINDDES